MANDMMNTLKGILGENADEKIQSVLSSLKSNQGSSTEQLPEYEGVDNTIQDFNSDSNDYISQIKDIVGQMGSANDTRSNLLLSLKPYMRAERKKSIDNAVRILNLTRLAGLFK